MVLRYMQHVICRQGGVPKHFSDSAVVSWECQRTSGETCMCTRQMACTVAGSSPTLYASKQLCVQRGWNRVLARDRDIFLGWLMAATWKRSRDYRATELEVKDSTGNERGSQGTRGRRATSYISHSPLRSRLRPLHASFPLSNHLPAPCRIYYYSRRTASPRWFSLCR